MLVPAILLAVLLGLAAAIAVVIVKTYNRLVAIDSQAENGLNQVSVQLQRRHDLIPNLVECVRSYMAHEKDTLEAVIAARNQASAKLDNATANPGDATALASLGSAEGVLSGALGRLSFVMEDYPELKADETVASLTEELTSTENRIAFARQAYNDWATAFNVMRKSFPTVAFAGSIGFGNDRSLVQFEDAQAIKQAPRVQLSAV